jgi:hypothetical protein
VILDDAQSRDCSVSCGDIDERGVSVGRSAGGGADGRIGCARANCSQSWNRAQNADGTQSVSGTKGIQGQRSEAIGRSCCRAGAA